MVAVPPFRHARYGADIMMAIAVAWRLPAIGIVWWTLTGGASLLRELNHAALVHRRFS